MVRRPSAESVSSIPRAATFSVPSVRGGRSVSAGTSGYAGGAASGHGAAFNAFRDVPPPPRPSPTSASRSRNGAAPMPSPSARGNALLTRAVVMVDEATEPGIGDAEGELRRVALVEMVSSGGDPRMGSATGSSPGAAVAFAIRKRLKSDDHVAVLNTLTLLDEVMRTCPYFYRYCANDKFFRRLWRFVDPEYKSDFRERLPFGRAGKVVAQQRSGEVNVELGERVLILIRAWAEELSIMHSGQQDPDAGFFVERYSNKRLRIKFPDVPPTATPWVCHVGRGGAGRSRFGNGTGSGGKGMSKTTSPLPKNLSLGEVENTVNLLENMMEKANDISEVETDVCADLVDRCRLISQHIDTMSATMEKDEDIARAIRVSERLHSTVAKYDSIMETGVFHPSVPPTVDGLGDDSADESYGPTDRDYSQGGDATRSSAYYDRESNVLGSALGGGAGAAADGAVGSSRRRSSDHSVASSSSSLEEEVGRQRQRAEDERESEREKEGRAREKAAAKKEKEAERKRAEKKEARRAADAATTRSSGKSEKAAAKAALLTSGKFSKSGKSSSRSAAAAAKDSLVDVADRSDTKSSASSTDSDEKKNGNVFSSLAERHNTNKSARSPPHSNSSVHRPLSTTGSVGSVGQGMSSFVGNVSDMSIRGGQQQGNGVPGSPQQQQQQQQQQQHPMQMSYGSMMMMPNPMAMNMYGSLNPAMQPHPQQQPNPQQQQYSQPQQPQGYGNAMPSAYNTINPAMYYSSFNPMAYGSVNPMMQLPQQMSQNRSPSQSSIPSQALSETSSYQPPPSQPGQFQLQQQSPASPLPQPGPMAPTPPMPAPPPLPQASSYVTVTSAPAPLLSEPPPPVVPAPAPPPAVSQDQSPGSSSAGQILQHNFPPGQQMQPGQHMQPAASFVQQPMFNGAMFSSSSGQLPMGNQSFLFPSPHQQPGQQPGGQYNSVYGMPPVQGQGHPAPAPAPPAPGPLSGPPGLPSAQGQPDASQASVYQMAMANAAAAYNAAASAYQSVHGPAPLVSQAAPPSSTSNPQESTNVPQ